MSYLFDKLCVFTPSVSHCELLLMFLFNKGIVEAKKIFLLTLMLFQTCVTSVEHKRRYFKVILYFCPYNGSQQNLKQHWLSFYAPKHAGVITVKTFRTLEASQTEGSSFFFFFFFSHGSCQNFATCCNVYITKLGNVLLIKLWCCFARSTVTVFADSDHHLEKHSKRCSLSESVLVVQSKSKRSKTKIRNVESMSFW